MSINQQQRTYKPLIVLEDYLARKLRESYPASDRQLRLQICALVKAGEDERPPLTYTEIQSALGLAYGAPMETEHLTDLLMELEDSGEIRQVNEDGGTLVWRMI